MFLRHVVPNYLLEKGNLKGDVFLLSLCFLEIEIFQLFILSNLLFLRKYWILDWWIVYLSGKAVEGDIRPFILSGAHVGVVSNATPNLVNPIYLNLSLAAVENRVDNQVSGLNSAMLAGPLLLNSGS